LVHHRCGRSDGFCRSAFSTLHPGSFKMSAKLTEPNFAALLQRFFTERLIQQKNASPGLELSGHLSAFSTVRPATFA
jgi:hypothetical protein